MRVSRYGKQAVRPHDFWMAVLAVAALLILVGLYQMHKGPWLKEFGLVCVALGWVAACVGLVRRGRKSFSTLYLMFFIGYSLFFGEQIALFLTNGKVDIAGIKGIGSLLGSLLVIPFILSPFVDLGKRRLTAATPLQMPSQQVNKE